MINFILSIIVIVLNLPILFEFLQKNNCLNHEIRRWKKPYSR